MSSAGSIANIILVRDRAVKAAAYDGAARTCNAGMARADPIMVCGLVNLHSTNGKGTFGSSSADVVAADSLLRHS